MKKENPIFNLLIVDRLIKENRFTIDKLTKKRELDNE